MMKRIVAVVFFFGLFLVGVGLIAPSFIDWNSHKDKILAQVSPYLQRQIDVAGRISFRIIPQPEIILESVTVSNIEGAKSESFMTLKRLETRISLAPLLEGRIEVEDINLVDPVLNLEILGDGGTSWSAILKEKPSVVFGIVPTAVRLNRVTVTNGTVNYLNRVTGFGKKIENFDLSVTANTLLGPYNITGDMKYRNSPVKIAINLGTYKTTVPVPVNVSLTPSGSQLPKVTFDGIMDMQSGISVKGKMTAVQGSLGSLFDIDSLNRLGFMREVADMTCALEFKEEGKAKAKAKLVLSDIKAKFGKKGNLQGKITASFSNLRKPFVDINLEGKNLLVTDKSDGSYMNVPGDFDGSLHFKGKNIRWDGRKLGTVNVSAAFDQKEWMIKLAQVSLTGNSKIKLAGIMTPATDSADYKVIQIETDDLGKLVNALGPDDNSIFKSLSDTGLVKKFSLSSGLLVSPSRISFFNIDSLVNGKAKVSGVLNVDRSVSKSNFVAKLNFSDWDASSFPARAYKGFLRRIINSDADMELTAKNHVRNGIKIPDMSFKGKIDKHGINIYELKGRLSENDSFTMKGRLASLFPVSGMNISYVLNTEKSADVAKILGISIPPLPMLENSAIKGEVRGSSIKYDFTANSSDMALKGTVDGDSYVSDMTVEKFDLDKWLAGYSHSAPELSLKIRAGDLVWQGQSISNPVLAIEAKPSSVMISVLEGSAFGGKLKANMNFSRQEGTLWSSSFKGSLKQADLNLLKKKIKLSGFSLKEGDIDFDLKSSKNTLSTLAGGIGIRTGTLTVERFNFDKLGDKVSLLTGVPENFQKFIDNIFRKNGATIYKDVYGSFKIKNGKRLSIETLKLQSVRGDMSVSGSMDLKTGKYDASSVLRLKQPDGFPALKVLRTSKMSNYKVYSKPIGKFVLKKNPDKNAIKGILDRLDKEELDKKTKPSVPKDKKEFPASSPDPQWDINRIIKEMQMREIMPEGTGAMPLL